MNKQDRQKTARATHGFTIIEVVLVLAIAGLIFLMVFIALPALQRGQRDTQRKRDLASISTQITNFSSSSRGAVPTEAAGKSTVKTFVSGFLKGPGTLACDTDLPRGYQAGDDYTDPNGCNYHVIYTTNDSNLKQGEIAYHDKSLCGDGGAIVPSTAARDYALAISLEGQSAPYCIDSK